MTKRQGGYTLIELMLAVAIMAILAGICMPIAGDAIAKAKDATTLGNLGTMRAALATYYTNTEGKYPSFPAGVINAGYGTLLADTLVPAYLNKIPETMESGGHHKSSSAVGLFWNQTGQADDERNGYGAGYRYDANPSDTGLSSTSGWGSIFVLCNHTDLKGRSWTSY